MPTLKLAILALVIWLPALALSQDLKLTIAAAADLKYALDEVVRDFKAQHPKAKVDLIFGSSGKLYEQILHGAPFDLLFSADIQFPQLLKDQGWAASETRLYARGRIVLWSTRLDAGRLTLEDLKSPTIRKIAIANPRHAPYGMRAKEALERLGLWGKVSPKLVFGENVAQTAQFVETGAADVGVIALSLALSPALSAKGSYALIAQELHQPLDQGYVILKRAASNPLALAFAEFVAKESARAVFRRYGFVLPGESP